MKRIENKRGFAHFEMVISFVFFMGFMAFLFTVLSFNNTTSIPSTISKGLHDNFVKMTSTNLSTIFLKANYTGQDDCFYINLPTNLFSNEILDGTSHITNLDGANISSGIVGNQLSIEKNGVFFNVKFSPEFHDEGLTECAKLNDFVLGQPVDMKVMSYSALEKMQNEYFNNYKKLQAELGVPPTFDFAIDDNALSIKMEPKQIPNSVDIIAKDYMIEVLKSDGTLTNERFILKIW